MKTRNTIYALLTVLMSMMGVSAFAHDIEVTNSDGVTIYYNWQNNQTELAVSYQGSYGSNYSNEYTGTVVIPSTVTYNGNSYPVTSIGYEAFYNCRGLTSITIPNSVTTIGQYAFYSCSGLTDVNIGNSVTSIGNYAFYGCNGLTSVTIPNSVTSIGYSAFYNCSGLTAVTIGNSVTSIGGAAFSGCSGLTAVTIPNSVTSIESSAFSRCSGLTSVNIPNSVTSIGKSAFEDCSRLTSVNIPNSVTSIGSSAFYNCRGLTSVTIPCSVGSIGDRAFYGCSGLKKVFVNDIAAWCNISFGTYDANPLYYAHHLYSDENTEIKNLVIPNSVTSIGNSAFSGCSGLTAATIPNSVSSIGYSAFSGCSGLTAVTIPCSVTSIGYSAFSNCSGLQKVIANDIAAWCNISFGDFGANPLYYAHHLYSDENTEIKNLVIPNSVTSIGYSAFSGCSGLTAVTIPNSVTSIGNEAFFECSGLNSVIIPNSVTSIGTSAFRYCTGLTAVTIPNSVTSIDTSAFSGCSGLTSVTIPNSVTDIGWGAFLDCSGLTSATIGNSVTIIGGSAFDVCSGLTAVKVDKENPLSIDSYTFSNRANATLYVPKGSKAAYQSADYWNEFKAIVEFPDADVNQDGEIDVVDVVDIARFVVGTPAETFVEFLADLNNNGEVNVADAVVLVNEIVGDQNFAKAFGAPQTAPMGDDRLTLTKNDDHSLSFSMESQRNYTAFQFDLYTNSEDDVMGLRLNTARKHGHQLIYNKVDEGHYRVVALSVANNTFNGNNGELLNIQLDGFNAADMTISSIHFITTDGTDYRFDDLSLSNATGIEGLTPNLSPKEEGNVYDLSGRKVSESSVLPKGVYIMNGKKVIVK